MNFQRTLIRMGWLFLTCSVGLTTLAQDQMTHLDSTLSIDRARYLTLGLGSMSVQLNDEHMSPLNYYGGSPYVHLGAFKRKNKSIRQFTIGATSGLFGAKTDAREIDPKGRNIRFDLSYAHHYYLKSLWKGTTRWYVGGKVNSHTHVRLNPQLDGGFITFNLANGLYASTLLERDVSISKRPVTISWQVDLPIVNHVIRPDYLNIYDFVNPENDWLKERLDDSKWRSFATYQNVTSTISLLYPLSTTNILRFSYQWDYYHVHSELEARNATHTFLFSFLFHY